MHVWTPGRIGTLALPHRLIMGSMHLNLEAHDDGGAALAAFYAERASGGASLIVTGGIAVSRVGAGGRNYAVMGEHDASLARAVEATHDAGAAIAAQLFHAGRYAFESAFGQVPVAPSPVYSAFSRSTPDALSDSGIQDTLADFVRAAEIAVALGFDAIEVMGSEGYLVNQFLSPVTNLRDDRWGGDAIRRQQFPLTLVRMLKAAVDVPVIFRMSGADLVAGSSSRTEIADFATALARSGVDAINVGVGWHEAKVPTVQSLVPPGVWVPEAEAIKAAVGDLPVIASNRINRVEQAEEILAGGRIDFVSMARPFLADPALVRKARSGIAINTCIACNEACIDRSIGDAPVSCLVNPRAGRELEFPEQPEQPEQRSAGPRRFAVVGGGPAGLEAARALATRGHRVVLYEAEAELGGQFRLARTVPGKTDFGEMIRYFEQALPELGVDVRLRQPASADELRGYAGIVLACGVVPRRPPIPGIDLPHVIDYAEAFADPDAVGERVAVIGGGGIAVDLAHLLLVDPIDSLTDRRAAFRAEWGIDGEPVLVGPKRSVTLSRRRGKIGAGMGLTTRWVVVGTIARHGARMRTGVDYREITSAGLLLDTADGPELIEADTVVVAAGQEPDDRLVGAVAALGVPYRVVGGAAGTAGLNAVRATTQGLEAARELASVLAPSGE